MQPTILGGIILLNQNDANEEDGEDQDDED
jgi:hypothetical protein